jgi:hypothetical protein
VYLGDGVTLSTATGAAYQEREEDNGTGVRPPFLDLFSWKLPRRLLLIPRARTCARCFFIVTLVAGFYCVTARIHDLPDTSVFMLHFAPSVPVSNTTRFSIYCVENTGYRSVMMFRGQSLGDPSHALSHCCIIELFYRLDRALLARVPDQSKC